MLTAPIRNERGERLLAIAAPDGAAPASFVLVIARHADRFLLVHNRRRSVWELPGGYVDPGESEFAAALRELREESAQRATSAEHLADLLVASTDGVRRHGRVYAVKLDRQASFTPNDEIDAIAFHRRGDFRAPVSAIDACLLERLG